MFQKNDTWLFSPTFINLSTYHSTYSPLTWIHFIDDRSTVRNISRTLRDIHHSQIKCRPKGMICIFFQQVEFNFGEQNSPTGLTLRKRGMGVVVSSNIFRLQIIGHDACFACSYIVMQQSEIHTRFGATTSVLFLQFFNNNYFYRINL